MGSPSRSPAAQGRGVPPRADARYHGDQAPGEGMLDVRAACAPSWLVERLAGRLAVLGRYPSDGDCRRATNAVDTRHGALDVLARLSAERAPWPLGTLPLEVLR